MRNELEAAHTIASAVSPAEEAIDAALAANVKLMAAVIEGRQAAGVAVSVGQHAMAQIAESQSALIEARQAILRAHKSLAETGRDLNIPAHAYGHVADCPEGAAKGHLTVVAA
jgi:hypothetical protein